MLYFLIYEAKKPVDVSNDVRDTIRIAIETHNGEDVRDVVDTGNERLKNHVGLESSDLWRLSEIRSKVSKPRGA